MFDLPEYIESRYPGALVGGYNPRKTFYQMRCLWRGADNHPSGSLQLKGGRWLWYDFAMLNGGDAVTFLTKVESLPMKEALQLANDVRRDAFGCEGGKARMQAQVTPSKAAMLRLRRAQDALLANGLPPVFASRGLNLDDAIIYGIGCEGGNVIIPITNLDGEITAIKIRLSEKESQEKGRRYSYMEQGYSDKVYWNTVLSKYKPDAVLLLEGEAKAISAHNALTYFERQERPKLHIIVVGLPGANAKLPIDKLKELNLPVYVLPDKGEAGFRAVHGANGWDEQLAASGLKYYIMPPLPDMCDLAHAYVQQYGHEEGNTLLGEQIQKLMQSARLGNAVRIRVAETLRKGGYTIQKMLAEYKGNKVYGMFYAIVGMLRKVASGNFYIYDQLNEERRRSTKVLVEFSLTECAAAVGAGNRKQGYRTLTYLKQAGLIVPHPELVSRAFNGMPASAYVIDVMHPVYTSSESRISPGGIPDIQYNDYTETTSYTSNTNTSNSSVSLNLTSTFAAGPKSSGGSKGWYVRDVNSRNRKDFGDNLGVRASMVLEYLKRRRHKKATVYEIASHFGWHTSTTYEAVKRLLRLDLVDYQGEGRVVTLRGDFRGVLEAYRARLESYIKAKVTQLWESVSFALFAKRRPERSKVGPRWGNLPRLTSWDYPNKIALA